MTKRKVRPTARGYIRKNREAILKLLWDCQTDIKIIGEDYCAWCRVFKSDRGNAVQILLDFKALLLDLYRCHKDRSRGCTAYNCGLLKRMRFRMRSLDVSFIRFRQ